MRWSRYYLFTTREVPADAEVISHQLMVRAGMTKKLAAGIYSYLPLGWRSIAKLSAIVRRGMEAAGATELVPVADRRLLVLEASGDRSETRFSEVNSARTFSPEDESRYFSVPKR
mgnify:CR=1 FL=1